MVKKLLRTRHYTSLSNMSKIQLEGIIKASAKQWEGGCVYCELISGKRKQPMSPKEAEEHYGLKRGRGNAYIEFDANEEELREVTNPRTNRIEWVIDGDVSLENRNPVFEEN